MCGISGIVRKDGSPVEEQRIRHMTDLVAHRGPDDSGLFFRPGLALGHRRLSIIDLNPRGRQPMSFEDRYWITYNGEIYNYLELRHELEAMGVRFKTATDTEVVLAAYARWGVACLSRFNGMWAFAVYDSLENHLFLARDRFGIKPLYYLNSAKEFAFGSELKQLTLLQERVRANQWAIIESLLTYFDGHTEETFFADIRALPQSHYMIYDLQTHTSGIHRYYELQPDEALLDIPLTEAIERFRGLLEDSVGLRLRSDVQVGSCLSGGLDSSSISALASRKYRSSSGQRFAAIHAKSIESRTDESPFANMVADHADIRLWTVAPSTRDFKDTIDEVVYTQEEPFGGPSIFMGWHVFREARQRGCRVMLDGQGGDEVLLGYEKYYSAMLRGLSPIRFVKEVWQQSKNSGLTLVQLLQYYVYFTNPRIRIQRLKFRNRHLLPEIRNGHCFDSIRTSATSYKSVQDLQKCEIGVLQLPQLLRQEDRNSMRHSIETRLPFLDYRLVEMAVSLPLNHKIRGGWTKYLLREAITDALPKEIVWRKNKMGFEAPTSVWLAEHTGAMKEEVRKSEIVSNITHRERLVKKFPSLSLLDQWAYFNLAVWERLYNVSWS